MNKKKNPIVNFFKYLFDIFVDAFVIILAVVLVRYFFISPFQVNGSSMVDTFYNGDYIFVEKLTYRFEDPGFGDIVIFEPPVKKPHKVTGFRCLVAHLNSLSLASDTCNIVDFYIKRVIGVPGDKIEIKDGAVYRNGELLDESSYLNSENNGKTYLPNFQEQTVFEVPKDSIFVLGDNRNGSSDSRYWKTLTGENKPFVSYEDIEGKYLFRLFSPNQIF